MVTGFENITFELTDFERDKILPIVSKAWEYKPLEIVVNAVDMIDGVNQYCVKYKILTKRKKPYKMTGPRLRKIIHHLRVSGTFPNLIATSKGYFLTNDKEKIREFIESCRERANSFLEVAEKVEYYNFR